MYDTVKIGTEFTFRREEFIFGLKDLAWSPGGSRKQAKPDETALGQIRAAGVEIINWVNDIAAAGKSGKLIILISDSVPSIEQFTLLIDIICFARFS